MRLWPAFNPLTSPLAAHPLVQVEQRRHVWAVTRAAYWRMMWRSILVAAVVVFVIWGGLAALNGASFRSSLFYRGEDILVLLVVLSLAAGLLIDLICFAVSAATINQDMSTGLWDLLRLTSLSMQGIVLAKHEIAQLRCARSLYVLVGVRLGLALVSLTLYLFPTTAFPQLDMPTFTNALLLLMVFGVYLLEPFWRVRAMTSVGIYVSAQTNSVMSTFLSGFFMLMKVWLAQLVVLGIALFGITFALIRLSMSFNSMDYSVLMSFCFSGAWLLVLLAAVYGFYALLEQWSLRATLRRLLKLN